MRTITITTILAALLAAVPACDLDVPDLNNPGIDDLEENPTAPAVTAACTGLLIGNRRNHAAANGFVAQLGIVGREAYNFDQADPRFVGELLQGTLNRGSPFGGNFWTLPYANVRLANTVLGAVEKVPDFSPEEKAGIRGFTKTIMALDLLEVISTRDDIGAVIDTNKPIGDIGAIVDKTMVLTEIARLLDDGAMDLMGAGDEFPFKLSNGFAGFDEPMSFRTVNRAVRARVAAYQKNYAVALTALGESFIDDTMVTVADLDVGVYYSYSTGPGDTTNALINPNIFAHPSLKTDVMMNGTAADLRFTRKVEMAEKPGSAQGLTSDIVFTIYTSPASPVALIRNEELLLLRAEAKFFTSDAAGAMTDLNLVRTTSGGLAMIGGGAPSEDAFVTALLYEREFSLLFEGHRWIDVRRFGRLDTLPLDAPDHTRNRRYPIPQAECNARPGEAACELTSI
ncbi:MAG TPA: RagB/SusD family nutrient uptake outer membrane protein [Kofleriaceae bacterium]